MGRTIAQREEGVGTRQDWSELKRRWKQFLAALFSIKAEDLIEVHGREGDEDDRGELR